MVEIKAGDYHGDRRVRIIGSGFREHALLNLARRSPQIAYLDIAPGNGGTIRHNIPIAATNIDSQVKDAKDRGIDTVIVGPEDPLALGIRDRMNAAGIDVFGPTASEARIESSKWFAIQLMQAAGIPHPRTEAFYDEHSAKIYLESVGFENIVIKEDYLKRGQGVYVPDSLDSAHYALSFAFKESAKTGTPVLLQSRVRDATEASFMAIVDGEHIVPLPSSQDYKRIGNNDTGPNTGGVGAFAPTPTITPELSDRIMQEIMYPILSEMKKRGMNYKGILYAGLMIDKNGNPVVIEFNCRGGDPEFPVIYTLLKEDVDIIEIIDAVENGTLREDQVRFLDNMVSLGIVATSGGYPGNFEIGQAITGLDQDLDSNSFLFHSGTRLNGNRVETNGGRVALAVGRAENFTIAKEKATKVINQVVFKGGQHRDDIGNNKSLPY